MKKRKKISFAIFAISVLSIPAILAGYVFYTIGTLLRCFGYLCLMQPHNAYLQILNFFDDLKTIKF